MTETPSSPPSPPSSSSSQTRFSTNDKAINNFEIFHENVRSVMNKKTEILLSTRDLEYDCISINETWLHPSHNNSEFINDKYNVFRKDRKFSDIKAKKGGGVLLAVHKKYDCELVTLPECEPLEAVCVRVALKSTYIYIYCLYIRNRLNTHRELTEARYNNHLNAIKAVTAKCSPADTLIILGDFNLPYVNWTSDSGDCDEYGFLPEIGDSESIEANLSRKITSELLNLGLYQMF